MKKKATSLLLILLAVSCFLKGYSQTHGFADSSVQKWVAQENLRNASIGVYLQDASSGELIGSYNPRLSLAPASTLKLVTTATALEMLGPGFRFTTTLAIDGTIRNDSLLGNLIIIGGGDPALGSEYFHDHYLKNHFLKAWTDSLRRYNIRHISGGILTDASIYDDQSIPDTWIWEDIGNYYGAGVSGLSVYDNSFEIHLCSPPVAGRQTRIVSVNPTIPDMHFDNRVVSSDDQRDLAYVFGSPLDSDRLIRGSVPKGRKDFTIRASIPDPAFLLATQLRDSIMAEGITVDGTIGKRLVKSGSELKLATTLSPPLIDIIRLTNHESVNLFAEHLLKHLAYIRNGHGSTQKGINLITEFWKEKGIDIRGLFLYDGSGLSRFNAVTAEQMVNILAYMKNESKHSPLFFNSMPAVPDGTLSYFDPLKFPNQRLRAKSGSMTRVRCYAGLLTTSSERQILFAIFLNNFSGSPATTVKAVETLLADLYRL
ncbi:MAG: D-alanyl-D-alanine carboxypeptidase/D-alanyl-D-alanine-endopeptidase [Prolixibacteraceae bacterium]